MYHGCKPLPTWAAIPQSMNSCLSNLQTALAFRNTKYPALFISTHRCPSGLRAALLAMAGVCSTQNIEYWEAMATSSRTTGYSPPYTMPQEWSSWGSLGICGFALSSVETEDSMGQSILAHLHKSMSVNRRWHSLVVVITICMGEEQTTQSSDHLQELCL